MESPLFILLRMRDDKVNYAPITQPISGKYNYLGYVEGLCKQDQDYLIKLFDINKYQLKYQVEDIELLLSLVLEGGGALIYAPVWNAIAQNYLHYTERNNVDIFHPLALELIRKATLEDYPFADYVEEKLEACQEQGIAAPTNDELMQEHQKQLDCSLDNTSTLETVNQFLSDRGLRWKYSEICSQHPDPEMWEYLREARQNFSDCPWILEKLIPYEIDLTAYFREHEEDLQKQ